VLIVYLTRPGGHEEQQVREFTGLPVEKIWIREAAMTSGEAKSLEARFSADAAGLITSGIAVQGWGVGEGVVLEVEVLSTGDVSEDHAQEVELLAQYGPHVRVVHAAEEPRLLAGRAHDASQWRGGSFLNSVRDGSNVACTSGVALTWPRTGNKYLLTAGHCYRLGERVYNGIGNVAGGWNSNVVGTVTNRSFNIGYPDAALIQADARPEVWTGSSAAPSGTRAIDTLTDPWRNMPLCIDGAYEGEYCGMTVINPDRAVTTGGVTFAHQAELTSSNLQAAGDGDSGGPAYATIYGVTYGVGIISSAMTVEPCRSWSAQIGGRQCGSTVFTQNILPVLGQWNVVLDR
jgi:hypothetical protein